MKISPFNMNQRWTHHSTIGLIYVMERNWFIRPTYYTWTHHSTITLCWKKINSLISCQAENKSSSFRESRSMQWTTFRISQSFISKHLKKKAALPWSTEATKALKELKKDCESFPFLKILTKDTSSLKQM